MLGSEELWEDKWYYVEPDIIIEHFTDDSNLETEI